MYDFFFFNLDRFKNVNLAFDLLVVKYSRCQICFFMTLAFVDSAYVENS